MLNILKGHIIPRASRYTVEYFSSAKVKTLKTKEIGGASSDSYECDKILPIPVTESSVERLCVHSRTKNGE